MEEETYLQQVRITFIGTYNRYKSENDEDFINYIKSDGFCEWNDMDIEKIEIIKRT